jgi:integrase/recombinase XerD
MNQLTTLGPTLSVAQFQQLCEVPPEAQWFANLDSEQTRRAYRGDIEAFSRFAGIQRPEDFRAITRAHVLAWRADLERQALAGASIRRKLAALASLFDFLCNANAVTHNPVRGVKRPRVESQEGKTPALSNAQASALLQAPAPDTVKGLRDRAILSVLLHHGLRREELVKLRVKDAMQQRRGVAHLSVHGKGGKLRWVELHPQSQVAVAVYLKAAGHAKELDGALFRSLGGPRNAEGTRAMKAGGVYSEVVKHYMAICGIEGENMGPHALRATAATNALENGADLSATMRWLGHANISTTKIYDRRGDTHNGSPTQNVHF